jgi:hypothetical protein
MCYTKLYDKFNIHVLHLAQKLLLNSCGILNTIADVLTECWNVAFTVIRLK